MANMHLVTGYAGQDHITAADQGAFNAALIGTGQFVLDKGNVFEAQVISNNQVRVLDGELMMQGRFIRLDPDTYIDLTIENGTQGVKRNDLIVARYTKDSVSGVEECNLVVIKGTGVASNPSDPAYTEADITQGLSTQNDFPLWRIPLDGLNVGTPEAMFGEAFGDSMLTLPEIRDAVNRIHEEVDEKIAGIESYTKEETLTTETKALFDMDATVTPNNVFAFLGRYNKHWWEVTNQTVGFKETKTDITEDITISTGYATIQYSTSIGIDQFGVVSLVDPQSLVLTADNCSDFADLAPVYFKTDYTNTTTIYYLPSNTVYGNTVIDAEAGTAYLGTIIGYSGGTVKLQYQSYYGVAQVVSSYYEETEAEVSYVYSTDRNAYPDSGTTGSATYRYLGTPFANAVCPLQIATGSYTGTGTRGTANPNSITFGFVPKLLIISEVVDTTYTGGQIILFKGVSKHGAYTLASGLSSTAAFGYYTNWQISGTTVSWCVTSTAGDAENQGNKSGTVYNYFAIG